MLFGLINYTDDWSVEGTIDLDTTPSVGDLVWCNDGQSEDFEDSIYYIDNVMYGEKCTYLMVRPYTEYGKTPPQPSKTQTELLQAIDRLNKQIASMQAQLNEQHDEFYKLINGVCNDIAEINSTTNSQQENLDKIAEYLHSID